MQPYRADLHIHTCLSPCGELEMLPAAIETGTDDGMQSFGQCIYQLIRNGLITEEDGMMRTDNPEALKMNLKGIFLNESRRILTST